MMHVVVPSYNCMEWLPRCLESIHSQQDVWFDVIVIDDCSTDPNQPRYVKEYCKSVGWRYQLNSQNMGAGYNLYDAVNNRLQMWYDDPVLIVDGDDFLPHNGVLKRIEEIYQDKSVWLMWAQYEPYPFYTTLVNNQPVKVDPTTTGNTQTPSGFYTQEEAETPGFFRKHSRYNHPITFRAGLFQAAITPADLQLPNGAWALAGYDKMIMTPMLESAGYEHIKFVDEVLYLYNSVNPISDVSVRLKEAKQAHERVASLPIKPPLEAL